MEWTELLEKSRWAALGTVDETGNPHVSNVAIAITSGALLIHVSQLAAHTRNLLAHPHFSLLLSETDPGGTQDPQTLARLTISGDCTPIQRDHDEFPGAAKAYIARFPESEMRFEFGDFHLLRLTPTSGNFVGGFGAAARLKGDKIAAALV